MADSPGILRFGVFEVHLAAGELRKNGSRIKLQEQPFQVLVTLLRRPGEIVTREELKEKLWAGDTFVDFDHSLSTAVNKIREALGDSATSPRFIETVPRRGYRFLAPREAVTADGRSAVLPDASEHPHALRGKRSAQVLPADLRRSWLRRGVTWGAALLCGAVLLLAAGSLLRQGIEAPDPVLKAVPLTSYPGSELSPSFSPDGNQVAFSWDGPGEDNFDIYIRLVGAEPPLRLTSDPRREHNPSWSPDGRWIAFLRSLAKEHFGVYVVPALGGAERKVAEVAGSLTNFEFRHGGPAWSQDGQWLIVPDSPSPTEPFSLFRIAVDSGEKHRLTSPASNSVGDFQPAVSPDGAMLAFRRALEHPGSGDLYVVDVADDLKPRSRPRRLTTGDLWDFRPAWAPDSRGLITDSGGKFQRSLYRIDLSLPNTRSRLAYAGEGGSSPAVSLKGNRLVYSQEKVDIDVWSLEVSLPDRRAAAPVKLIPSTGNESMPAVSADGKRVAVQSDRSGSDQVWVMDRDGSNARQLTFLPTPMSGSPGWSPDGKQIAFDSDLEGRFDIYVVNSDGGKPRRLTTGGGFGPAWSRDGLTIYFSGPQPRESQIWKIPAAGGEAVRVTREGGARPEPSADGRWVYFRKGATLWRVPSEGGPETQILDSIYNGNVVVVDDGIYFVPTPEPDSPPAVYFSDLAGSHKKQVCVLDQPLYYSMAASHDGRTLLFTATEQSGSDLMLVENFE